LRSASEDDIKHLLKSIDTPNIVDLRDQTQFMVLAYTTAGAKLKIGDYYSDDSWWWFHLDEKGGTLHLVHARHNLRRSRWPPTSQRLAWRASPTRPPPLSLREKA
jgi:hypothetical protein